MSTGIAAAGMIWRGADKPVPLPVQALDHATGYLIAAAAVRALILRLSDDDRADQAAKLQQGVPVTPVTGQTRRLHRHDGADAPFTDRREQPLEARAPDTASRSAQIIVDDFDVLPGEQSRSVGKAVLSTLALQIVSDLFGRRLPDVDDCARAGLRDWVWCWGRYR
jgi:hypothetical protein